MINKTVKTSVFLAMMFCLISCGSKSFVLSGHVDGTRATEAVLAYDEIVDTVEVIDGVFEFKGEVVEPTMAALAIEGRQTTLMLENAKMTFEGAVDVLVEAAITGSESQVVYDLFIKENGKHQGSQQEYIDYCVKFCKENTSSYFTPYLIASIAQALDPNEVMAMIKALSPEVQKSKYTTEMKAQLEKILGTSNGGKAPEFTMNDVDDKPVKLADAYKQNKYTLIDFWASWCGPCRAENPNVVASYNKYKSKGFGVFGVSLDQNRQAWLKAIVDDELVWVNVSDLKGWKSDAATLYQVRSIPASFLVDSKGNIVAKNLRGKALDAKLSELLD